MLNAVELIQACLDELCEAKRSGARVRHVVDRAAVLGPTSRTPCRGVQSSPPVASGGCARHSKGTALTGNFGCPRSAQRPTGVGDGRAGRRPQTLSKRDTASSVPRPMRFATRSDATR